MSGYNEASQFADGHFSNAALNGTLAIGTTGVKVCWGVIVATNAGTVIFRQPSGGTTYWSVALTAGQVHPIYGSGYDSGLEINTSAAMSVHVHTLVP